MTGEYSYILHAYDFEHGYDGIIKPNMVLCVESYIGAENGTEGVKLEQQVLELSVLEDLRGLNEPVAALPRL